MHSTVFTKKILGTFGIVVAFFVTSFIGVTSASAYFSLIGKNIEFHAIVENIAPGAWTLLTSSTDPITVIVDGKTKFPSGTPNVGDVIYVVAKIQKDSSVVAKIIKQSQSGGPSDIYGTDGDQVTVKKAKFVTSQCPWLRVTDPMNWTTTLVFKVTPNTHFVGTKGCTSLKDGDVLSITGIDTNENGFVAKTVIKHKKGNNDDKKDGKNDDGGNNIPDDESEDN